MHCYFSLNTDTNIFVAEYQRSHIYNEDFCERRLTWLFFLIEKKFGKLRMKQGSYSKVDTWEETAEEIIAGGGGGGQ
jgi:hypothetical protein